MIPILLRSSGKLEVHCYGTNTTRSLPSSRHRQLAFVEVASSTSDVDAVTYPLDLFTIGRY